MRMSPFALMPRRLRARLMAGATLQLVLISVAVGALAYWSGRRSGLERAELERQQGRMTLLSQQLSSRLAAPRSINALNMAMIRQGLLSLNDFDALAAHFVAQMRNYPVGYINYGTVAGDFIGVERRDDGSITLSEDSDRPLGRGTIGIYAVTTAGRRGQLLEVIPGMTTIHGEAWYAETVKANRPVWSSVYAWEERPEVFSISYNEPVRGADGRLRGVIGVDFVLSQLSTWLEQVWRDQQGLALVVERNGMVVAASQPGLTRTGKPGQWRRARIDQLASPLARLLTRTYFEPGARGGLQLRPGPLQPDHQAVEREGHLLDAQSWGKEEGLNWLLLTATGSDAAVQANRQLTLLALGASLLAILLALLIAGSFTRWMLEPLQVLRRRALEAAPQVDCNPGQLVFNAQLAQDSAVEIEQLAQAFGELVQRLNNQSAALLQQEAQLEAKLRSSLQAAAVAHEIKLPLSTMLLNTKLLLDQAATPSNAMERERLKAVGQEAERVVATIEKMRTLLRSVQTEHVALDLAGVARSALLQLKGGLRKAAVLVIRDPSLERPITVQGDPAQIQIAIVNVLRNAIEALSQQPPANGQRRIDIQIERVEASNGQPGWVDLLVDDNGPGFPAELQTITPLETTKPQGSGLGLFVVETTMANHQGEVRLERSPWGGARARLRFPAS